MPVNFATFADFAYARFAPDVEFCGAGARCFGRAWRNPVQGIHGVQFGTPFQRVISLLALAADRFMLRPDMVFRL